MKKKIVALLVSLLVGVGTASAVGIDFAIGPGLTKSGVDFEVGLIYADTQKSGWVTGFIAESVTKQVKTNSSYGYPSYTETIIPTYGLYEKFYYDFLFLRKPKFDLGLEISTSAFIGYTPILISNYGEGGVPFNVGIAPEVDVKFGICNFADITTGFRTIISVQNIDCFWMFGTKLHFGKRAGKASAKKSSVQSVIENNNVLIPSDRINPRIIIVE